MALGQPRAVVPDDIPRLSALPLNEREGITTSPAVEGNILFMKHADKNGGYLLCFLDFSVVHSGM